MYHVEAENNHTNSCLDVKPDSNAAHFANNPNYSEIQGQLHNYQKQFFPFSLTTNNASLVISNPPPSPEVEKQITEKKNNEEHNPDSNVSHFAINQIFSENYDQLYNQKQMTTHNVSHVNSEPDTLVDNNPKPHRDGRDDEEDHPQYETNCTNSSANFSQVPCVLHWVPKWESSDSGYI